MKKFLFLPGILFFLINFSAHSQEGTKQFMPNATDRLWLELFRDGTKKFATYSATDKERLYIYLNAGETMHFGMRIATGYNDDSPSNKTFRIKNPSGTVVYPETRFRSSGAGYISTYTQAVTGANGVILNGTTVTGGYTPLTYTAATTGNHYIEFEAWRYTIGTPGNYTVNYRRFAIQYFDVTVTDASNNVVTNPGEPNVSAGRLWSKGWAFTTTSYNLYPIKTQFFVFTADEFVNKVQYEMKPYSFNFVSNSYGVDTSSALNVIQKAQSQDGDLTNTSNISEYSIFLNDPDRRVWQNTTLPPPVVKVWFEETLIYDYNYSRNPQLLELELGTIPLEKNSVTCPYSSVTMFKIRSNIDGFTSILLDIDGGGYSTDGNDRALHIDVKKGLNYVLWDFKNDNGNIVTNGIFKASATFLGRGPAHFPLYDVESLSGISTFSIRPFNKLGPTLYWDDTQITTWGDLSGTGAMDETDTSQLIIENHVPRLWVYDPSMETDQHNGNQATLNSWFNAIDLGLPRVDFTVSTSLTKCINGDAPYVGDVSFEGGKNTDLALTELKFKEKFFDPNNLSLDSIIILSLPSNGTLKLSGLNVNVNDKINNTNISSLRFTPNTDWSGITSFKWNGTNGTYYANASDTVFLIINTAPTISAINDTTICTNTSLVNLPFIVGDAETDPTGLTVIAYSHNTDLVANSNITVGGSGENRTITVTPDSNESGFAIIYVKVDDGLTSVIEEFSLYVGPSISFQGDTTICDGDDLELSAVEFGADSYLWEFDGSTVSTTRNLTVSPFTIAETGIYTLTITKDGCSTSRDIQVSIFPLTTFAGDNLVCEGEQILLSATETVANSYTWRRGATTIATSKILNIPSATALDNAANYTLSITKEGCSSTSPNFAISVIPAPDTTLTITGDTVLVGNNAEVKIVSSQNAITYKVYIGANNVGEAVGTGSDLVIPILPADLSMGNNTINLTANNANCEPDMHNTALIIVNGAPDAVNDTLSVNEDNTLNGNVLTNDSDPNGNNLSVNTTPETDVQHGSLTLNGDGAFSYTPSLNFFGTDSFEYRVCDDLVPIACSTAKVYITIDPQNDAPVAVAETYSVNEGVTLDVNTLSGVLSNDTDAEGDDLFAILCTDVGHGILTLNADGSFSYTHDGSETTFDSFIYKPNDGTVDGNTVTVTITVNPQNDAPVAVADAYLVNEGDTLNINALLGVLFNDTDAEGGGLSAILVTDVSHGILTLNADGSFSYTHDGSETTSDSFIYKPNDGTVDGNTVTVTITVNPQNDAPVAVADAYSVNEGNTLIVNALSGVLGNDTDIEGDGLSAVLVNDVLNGNLTLNADGSFTYIHNGNETTSDSFTYKPNDGTVDGNTVTVTITINPQNDAPVAMADAYSVNEGATLDVNALSGVLSNDTDADGDGLSAILITDVSYGILTLNADGSFSYIHDGSQTTSDSFTYKPNDGIVDGNTVTVDITINEQNDPPVSLADTYSMNEAETLDIDRFSGVLSNDTDAEGSMLTAILVTDVSNGNLTLNEDGSFTYIHNGSETTSDSFTYKANDGIEDGNTVTVTITVNLQNDAPVAVADAYSVNEGATLNVNALLGVLSNDTDAEWDVLSSILVTDVSHGSLTLNSDGSFSYTQDGSETSSDSFTYKPNDGTVDGNTVTVAITVNLLNNAPVAVADAYSVNEGATLNVNALSGVLGNDTDAEGDVLSSILVTNVGHGSLTLNANGSFTYTHDGSETISDNFIYKVNDGTVDGNTVTVTITINPQNDTPVAVADTYNVVSGGTLMINATSGVLDNDSDAEGNTLSAIRISDASQGILSLNPNGSFTYVNSGSDAATDQFSYKVNDGYVDGNTVIVTITITGNNTPPDAKDDAAQVNRGQDISIQVTANDIDDNLDLASLEIILSPISGTSAEVLDNGYIRIKYRETPAFYGMDLFKYRICDEKGECDSAKVVIEVVNRSIVVPNTFSPNDDGKNDLFVIPGIENYPYNELSIFNRWGNEVYRSSHYQNDWNGKMKNKSEELPTGTYFYILKLESGQPPIKGFVYITR